MTTTAQAKAVALAAAAVGAALNPVGLEHQGRVIQEELVLGVILLLAAVAAVNLRRGEMQVCLLAALAAMARNGPRVLAPATLEGEAAQDFQVAQMCGQQELVALVVAAQAVLGLAALTSLDRMAQPTQEEAVAALRISIISLLLPTAAQASSSSATQAHSAAQAAR